MQVRRCCLYSFVLLALLSSCSLAGPANGGRSPVTPATVTAVVAVATSIGQQTTVALASTPTLVATVAPSSTPADASTAIAASQVPPAATTAVVVPTAPSPSATATELAPTVTPAAATASLPTTPAPSASATRTPPSTTVAPTARPSATSLPTPGISPTTIANAAAPGGVIFFLDADGSTIKTIHPDGSSEFVLVNTANLGQEIANLTADPGGTYLLFSADGTYYIVQAGRPKVLERYQGLPRWAPDGHRFAAATASDAQPPWRLIVYDAATGARRDLHVDGLAPDWFPDGQALVYANQGNVYRYDFATGQVKALTNLPTVTEQAWAVEEPHVLPDGQHVIFFGGKGNTLGASGNGQQWWVLPASGGEPQPWSDVGGNGTVDWGVNSQHDAAIWSESAHVSACESAQQITVSSIDVPAQTRLTKAMSELDAKRGPDLFERGLHWAPDGNHVVFATLPYQCNVPQLQFTGPPTIFIWNVRPDGALGQYVAPLRLVNGSYPVWTR